MTAAISVALAAGMLAAFNPCGIALLPAYLAALVISDSSSVSPGRRTIGRAVGFALGMTGGFILTFGLLGLAITPVTYALEPYLPYVTIVIGVVLVIVAVRSFLGRSSGFSIGRSLGSAPGSTGLSRVGYGIAFALASLSCTIGPFIAVVSTAARTRSLLVGTASFVVYAVGMGVVVLAMSLLAAVAGIGAARAMRRATPVVNLVTAVLLLVTGLYVTWYGAFEIRVLHYGATHDPVVDLVTGLQSSVSRWIGSNSVLVLIASATSIALALLALGGMRLVFRMAARDE
jgi:cytochrome c-type biogenesis protein